MIGHTFAIGDTFAMPAYAQNTYRVYRVRYARQGECLSLVDTLDGTAAYVDHHTARFHIGQAFELFGHREADAQTRYIGAADGTAHHVTTTGACLSCSH